jgi:hypothetical protein
MSQEEAWLNTYCQQVNNWIVINNFQEIVSHENTHYFVEDSEFIGKFNFKEHRPIHIYFTYMTECKLITLFKTSTNNIYLVNNKINIANDQDESKLEEDENKLNELILSEDKDKLPVITSVQSTIRQIKAIKNILFYLSGNEQKYIGIDASKWTRLKLKKSSGTKLDTSYLTLLNYIDNEEEYIKQLISTNVSSNVLNLRHNYSITNSILSHLPESYTSNIKQLILNNNYQLHSLDFLSKFKNLESVEFSYCNNIIQDHIIELCKYCPYLTTANFHYCCCLNIRILLPLLKLPYIKNICINYDNMWCQKGPYELFILPNEWELIDCLSLERIAINSKNMTLDIIDYIVKACPNIKEIFIDEEILTSVESNIINGYNIDEKLVFRPWQTPEKGLQVCKKIKFKNLYKEAYESIKSRNDFMEKIKKKSENKFNEDKLNEELDAILDSMTEEELKDLIDNS